jgi:hypothetical protein
MECQDRVALKKGHPVSFFLDVRKFIKPELPQTYLMGEILFFA